METKFAQTWELTTQSLTHCMNIAFLAFTGAGALASPSASALDDAGRSTPEPRKKRAALACDLSGDGSPSTTNTGKAPICSSSNDKANQ